MFAPLSGVSLLRRCPMVVTRRRFYACVRLLALVMGSAVLVGIEGMADPEEANVRVVAVVTHLDNEVDSVPRSELARMFLKQQTTWPNGERCIPIDQRGENSIRKEFSRIVLLRSVYEMKRYWMQETMTGNARPPVSLESAATVKKYVQKIEGAVAYIYLDEVDDTVRILAVTDAEELAQPPEDKTEGDDAGEAEGSDATRGHGSQDGRP